MKRKHITALVASLSMVAALTACSSDGDSEAPEANENDTSQDAGAGEEAPAEEQGGAEEAPAEDGGAASGSSDVSITLDGEAVEFADPTVSCADSEMGFAIGVTSGGAVGEETVAVVLTSAEGDGVTAATYTDAEGNAVAYAEGVGAGEPTVTVDGNTYTVSGEAMSANLEDPTSSSTVQFEFVITCP
ncbi:lipoprotein LpqH [Gulosibacter sp. 10]|uniref:lipoprotein LpqH n=1 Tax=Gulosibacter sp. 10 TaxID=1255570 RepID=UPI00097E8C0F|nr:lipoprotein LpqH [Gulosibacter sp. 10]SJM60189.1 putative lipoprotein [Gulosibacter sp. 10]